MRIVAKLLEDFAGDWHWVELHNAREVDPESRVFEIDGASTVCGIRLSGPTRTRLHETGAPSEPDCENCLHNDGSGGGLSLAARKDIEEALGVEVAEPVLVPVRR
jgi:hypothetical protein